MLRLDVCSHTQDLFRLLPASQLSCIREYLASCAHDSIVHQGSGVAGRKVVMVIFSLSH